MTLHEAYTQLAGEPWCMRPWEIARLTDYQIDHVYRLPAIKRAQEMESHMGQPAARPQRASAPKPRSTEPPPSREKLVALIEKWGARTREQAEREADERLANWQPDE